MSPRTLQTALAHPEQRLLPGVWTKNATLLRARQLRRSYRGAT
jgi:hypothetical protein